MNYLSSVFVVTCFLFSAHCLVRLYTYTRFSESIVKSFDILEYNNNFIFKFSKWHNSVKYEGRVRVLVLCTSFYDALYYYHVVKIFSMALKLWNGQQFHMKNLQRVISLKNVYRIYHLSDRQA